ncbi:hypothetical protein [Pseudoclavibacter endophyticus]|uniref:Uncharacterized protein n=1 Tax=Pseudoclavibacter endophyticus TaxID=1778590 RepID=A0A6H9WL23_9MICO|nr:hypothetical protein [Pseudoclavibacter endophyticus]KAB1648738.1 hypothetical protein F8O04_00010 [Pseudoclavibacter endophyticus]
MPGIDQPGRHVEGVKVHCWRMGAGQAGHDVRFAALESGDDATPYRRWAESSRPRVDVCQERAQNGHCTGRATLGQKPAEAQDPDAFSCDQCAEAHQRHDRRECGDSPPSLRGRAAAICRESESDSTGDGADGSERSDGPDNGDFRTWCDETRALRNADSRRRDERGKHEQFRDVDLRDLPPR